MEPFALYLLKSVIWLSGFTLVYFLFLRNERFFILKRYFLISGIMISIFFPLITVHYRVDLPAPVVNSVDFTQAVGSPVQTTIPEKQFDFRYILLILYLSGVLFFAFRLIRNIRLINRSLRKASINSEESVKLIRTPEFPSSFSFFNFIFINPSLSETEVREVVNHELVHIRQKHWFDLLMVELVRLLQWVNPFAWIYTGFIRLNHEHIADQIALRQTSDPAKYKAALLNQMFSTPVISLSNSFNYSLTKNRFDMMKKIITSPYRRLKVLFILPVSAIVFYAFATPEYKYVAQTESPSVSQVSLAMQDQVKGIVTGEDGKPLFLALVVSVWSNNAATIGVQTDSEGRFTLNDVGKDASLRISGIGYKDQTLKPDFTSEMVIKMVKDPNYKMGVRTRDLSYNHEGENVRIRMTDDKNLQSLIVIDDKISSYKGEVTLKRDNIESVKILKGDEATSKYGERGKDGVIEIITKRRAAELGVKTPLPVPAKQQSPDDFPTFQGESRFIFQEWIANRVQYPAEAKSKQIEGWVSMNFTVNTDGSVSNIASALPVNALLSDEVIRVIKSSPEWDPPKNKDTGKPFSSSVTLKFKLPDNILKAAPFVVVEEMPMYPGGDAELLSFIKNNIKYPEEARAEKPEGRVILRFIVTSEGNSEGISVLKGVHPLLDAEAIRLISSLKGWKPGMQGGKPVDVWYMVPVPFSSGSGPVTGNTQQPQFSKSSLTAIITYMAQNTIYPQEARNASDTGSVLVVVRMNKGGTIKGTETLTFSGKYEINVPVLPQVVIIGYKPASGISSKSNAIVSEKHASLRAECVRVVNLLGDLDIPEWKEKDMEFALAFKFALK